MSSHGALTPIYYGNFPLPPATAGATHTLTFALFTDPRKRVSARMGSLILKQELDKSGPCPCEENSNETLSLRFS